MAQGSRGVPLGLEEGCEIVGMNHLDESRRIGQLVGYRDAADARGRLAQEEDGGHAVGVGHEMEQADGQRRVSFWNCSS